MKTLSILGTSSNAGKSWVATALCAWLKRQGVNVAPFKAQNMANNAYATLEGGEMGVSQALQAEACGLRPVVEMNPILLKPSGPNASQIVRLGKSGQKLAPRSYYQTTEENWDLVRTTLDGWKSNCDVLVMEGAGSPVELNLMDRDIVNLRPMEYTNGKWLLVADIERGGVFPQVIGTWNLLPRAVQDQGLGFLVNQFRGDPGLFSEAARHFKKHIDLPLLGTLPHFEEIHLEGEDSMNAQATAPTGSLPYIAGVRYPYLSNTPDLQPWSLDQGIEAHWVADSESLKRAAAIVLPGSKHPIADLRWLRAKGLDKTIVERAKAGIPVVGLCGGLQMLGEQITDAAEGESEHGLGLLPLTTELSNEKLISRRRAHFENDTWETYEIHTGITQVTSAKPMDPLLKIEKDGSMFPDGYQHHHIWATYQHGLFESPSMRQRLIDIAGCKDVSINPTPWKHYRENTYARMAELLDEHVDLEPIIRYLKM